MDTLGIEPNTSRMLSERDNQLHHVPTCKELCFGVYVLARHPAGASAAAHRVNAGALRLLLLTSTTMAIDVADFASSNRPPTDSELEELREMLAPDEVQLAKLEQDIKANQEECERLYKEKSALLRKMRPARAAASWIRRLPTEIMAAIFLRSRGPITGYAAFRICDSPLVLLRVCRLWREIALKTPELWSSMNIAVPPSVFRRGVDPLKCASFEAEFQRWLERSANLPLTLRMRKGPHLPGQPPFASLDLQVTILRKLVAHSQRFQSLDFEAQQDILDAFSTDVPLPLLKTLRVSDAGWHHAHFDMDGPDSILDCHSLFAAPQLERLILLTNEGSPRRFSLLPVNWSRLTALTIGTVYRHPPISPQLPQSMITGLLPSLERCANLRQCHFSLPLCAPALASEERPITLPKLEALSLEGACVEMDRFLTLSSTPSIRELHFYPDYDLSEHSTSSFLKLFHKHGDGIEVLGFDLPTMTGDEFLSILKHSPALKQISLGLRFEQRYSTPPDYPFDNPNEPFVLADEHIVALTPTEEGEPMCPRLEVFRCDVKATVTLKALLPFLQARTNDALLASVGGTKLRELTLTRLPFDSSLPSFRPWMKDDDDPLTEIRESGVTLELARPIVYYSSDKPSFFPGNRLNYETDFRH